MPLDHVTDLGGAYLANCATRADGTLWCWGSNLYPSATSLTVGAGIPVEDVALHSACGSSAIGTTVRFLTTSDDLYRASVLVAQTCP